ncbi:MAG: flagellin [Beijerinckiaceae bacterium]
MSYSVALTLGMRNALTSIGDITNQQSIANKRLATGKKVNDVLDGPLNYFLAKGFDKNKSDLSNLMDSQNIALGTLSKTIKTVETIGKLVEQIQALARQARQSNDDSANGVRDTLGGQIATTLNQITELTRDAGFNGKNLLGEVPDTLQIDWNAEVGVNLTRLTVTGVSLTPNGAQLGFGTAAQGFTTTVNAPPTPDSIAFNAGQWTNDVAGNGRIDALITQSQTALNRLQSQASQFSVNLSILQVRIDYSKAFQRNLAQASDALTLADVNEEGANLAALNTRQQLSIQALSLANQSDQGILRLF